ncbi:MAG: guanylate kinase [Pseudomonadota bacterium]
MTAGAANVKRRGLMFVVSSPSGAGKTTLADRLLKSDPNLTLSISATTRSQRAGETDGVHYHFVDRARFAAMRDAGEFLEHAEVFGNLYGTPRAPVEEALAAGRDVLFDIDWQGARQIEAAAEKDLVRVFILPPSRAALEDRLRRRAQDPEDVVAKRMAKADDEMSHWAEYDYVIVNEDLDRADAELKAILAAERLKRRRRVGLTDFVNAIVSRS